jgi:magnesium-transporting ATPase (P-type)
MQTWVLTGDKMETAVDVARSSGVFFLPHLVGDFLFSCFLVPGTLLIILDRIYVQFAVSISSN